MTIGGIGFATLSYNILPRSSGLQSSSADTRRRNFLSGSPGTFPAIPADALPDVSYQTAKEQQLSVGTLPVLSQYHLTGSFRLFQKEHPEISLALTEVEESELMEGIERSDLP